MASSTVSSNMYMCMFTLEEQWSSYGYLYSDCKQLSQHFLLLARNALSLVRGLVLGLLYNLVDHCN